MLFLEGNSDCSVDNDAWERKGQLCHPFNSCKIGSWSELEKNEQIQGLLQSQDLKDSVSRYWGYRRITALSQKLSKLKETKMQKESKFTQPVNGQPGSHPNLNAFSITQLQRPTQHHKYLIMLDYLHSEKSIFTKSKLPNLGTNIYTLVIYFKL